MKKLSWTTSLLFLLVLFAFAAAFWILPDRAFSEQENRSLRTLPRVTLKKLTSGGFSEEINDYFSDQFPARDLLVGWKGRCEIFCGRQENDGILLGKDGSLARYLLNLRRADGSVTKKTDGLDFEAIQAACNGIGRANESLSVPFSILLAGRNLDVHPTAFRYPTEGSDSLLTAVDQALPREVPRVNTVPLFRRFSAEGHRVYYKTDHHWTTLGAYRAYVEIMRHFGMEREILPESSFEKRTVTEGFYGSLWSAAGMKWVAPDSVELWLTGDEDSYEVAVDGKRLDGFYSMKWLSQKDCYSVFLDGVHDEITIRREGEDRPTLLIVKDSFANSLAPFLARHFNLILLNLSSTHTDYTDLSSCATQYGADRVLLVYTLENLLTSDKLSRLH